MDRQQNPQVTRRRVRRRPRMVPFLISGALVGFVLGGVLSLVGPDSGRASAAQELISVAVPLMLLGCLLGAILYLVAERFSGRG